jgi:Asp-tRNA(Asn)/Glu-tRNA(Gln) amidotransferase A subunit family amidase
MNTFTLSRFALVSAAFSLCTALQAAEMDNGDRIYHATFGVITAVGFKKQIDADPICKGKTYADFDLNQFLDAIPKDFLTHPKQREGITNQFKGYFENIDTLKLPTGQTIPVAYQELKKGTALLLRKETESSDMADLCQKMYADAGLIFQKQIDSIKQLIVKK